MFADEFLVFFDKDSSNAIFCCNEMSFRTVNLNNINLDNNFEEGNLILLLLSDFWLGMVNSKTQSTLKRSQELIPIAWHPIGWWNFCMSEDEKKEKDSIFTW